MVNRIVVGAHYGLRDWMLQRITAVLMIIYVAVFFVQVLGSPTLDYATWRAIFGARDITPAQIAFWEEALARGFQGEDWKAWMSKNDVSAPPLRGAELNKYLESQYNNTRGVLVELGLAKQ